MELLVLVAIVAALLVLAAVALPGSPVPGLIAGALGRQPEPSPVTVDLDAAVAGAPGALTPHGAIALDGTVDLAAAVTRHLSRTHPAWFEGLTLRAGAGRGPARTITVTGSREALQVRVVTPAEEARYAATPTTASDRATAAATSLAWDGASQLARRLARPLGYAVSVLKTALVSTTTRDPVPAGTRADDIVFCQPVQLTTQAGSLRPAWRIGVLRRGQLMRDGLSDTAAPCQAPETPTG